eukprot:COSAG02_NODE_1294_length_13401_cov_32.784393_11_plen_133_part_00
MSGASCSCFCYRGNSHSIENYGPKNSHATCAIFWRDEPADSAPTFCYQSLRSMLDWLGLPANTKPGKCVPPCTECDILGIGFNTARMLLFITANRARWLQLLLHNLIASSRLTVTQLQVSWRRLKLSEKAGP